MKRGSGQFTSLFNLIDGVYITRQSELGISDQKGKIFFDLFLSCLTPAWIFLEFFVPFFNDYQMDLCALLDPRVIHFHSSFTLPSSSSNPAKYSSDFPPPTFRTVSIRRSITLLRDKVIKMPLTTYIIYAHICTFSFKDICLGHLVPSSGFL